MLAKSPERTQARRERVEKEEALHFVSIFVSQARSHLGLLVDKRVVCPVQRHQLRVRPLLDHAPVRHNRNRVGILDRRQPVRNNNRRAPQPRPAVIM